MCIKCGESFSDCGKESCSQRKRYVWDDICKNRGICPEVVVINTCPNGVATTPNAGGALACGLASVVSALNSVLAVPSGPNIASFNAAAAAYIACRTAAGGAGAADVTLLEAVVEALAGGVDLAFYTAAATYLGFIAALLLTGV